MKVQKEYNFIDKKVTIIFDDEKIKNVLGLMKKYVLDNIKHI